MANEGIKITQKEKQDYRDFNGILAVAFMHYLDEHRPNGKMCLSSMECKDIDDAFRQQDWGTLVNYAKKYSPRIYVERDAYDVYPIAPTPLGDDNRGFRLAYIEGGTRAIERFEEGQALAQELANPERFKVKSDVFPDEGSSLTLGDDTETVTVSSSKAEVQSWLRSLFESLVWRKDYPFSREEVLDCLR